MANRCLILALVALLGCGVLARGEEAPAPCAPFGPFHKVNLAQPEHFRRELALNLVEQLQDPQFRELLTSRLQPEVNRLSLNRLVVDYADTWPTPARQTFASRILNLDLDLRQSKGIQSFSQGLLGLDVIWPKGAHRALDWDTVLIGVVPQGPKRTVAQVEAYDLQGRLHMLSARHQPGVLVLMPGTDRGEAKRAGLALVNAGLSQANLAPPAAAAPALEPIYCAKLTYIRLADDQEPWWKGAAEVYAFTAGVDPTADKPVIKLIDLPYLAYDQTDYFPNQLILFWSDWRYNAANFQLWECDDGTNYQNILAAVLTAVTTAMATAGAPSLAWIPMLAQAIIQAMPAAWFTDNDDYLDNFYTLEKGRTYDHLPGASNNATISLAPFTLLPSLSK